MTLANVALTDTFDVWRTRTNQLVVQSNFYKDNYPNYLFANNIGVQANAFASATIAGANTAIGAGANSYANVVWSRANSRMDIGGAQANAFASATIAGANAAVGLGANSYTDIRTDYAIATIAGANTAIGAGANSYANVVWSRANSRMDIGGAQANAVAAVATNLTSGTVPSARLSGSYTGITGVGTISTGIWNAADIALADGGTGATLTASAGAIAYSNASAIILSSVGSSGQVLVSGGTGAPTWSNGLPVAQIPNAANLNTYTTPGQYHQSSDDQARTGTNYPVAVSGLLEVHASSLMVYQRYTTYNSGRIYTRSSYNGSWYSWLTNLDSMSYNAFAPTLTGTGAGGTWSINITGDAGYATTAGNATKLSSLDAAYSAAATSIAARDSAADITARLFRSEYADQTGIVGSIAFRTNNTTDNYIRYCNSPSAVRTWLGLGTMATQASSSVSISGGSISGLSSLGVSGDITATGDITAFSSDARLKGDIQPITDALSKVNLITGITYRHNDLAKSFGYTDENRLAGVLAQEVEAVLPEVVVPAPFDIADDGTSKSGENYKTVKYEKIIPLLIEAIKELSAQVKELKNK